jgi:hypothetical protein
MANRFRGLHGNVADERAFAWRSESIHATTWAESIPDGWGNEHGKVK